LVQGVPDYEKARFNAAKLGFSQPFVDYLVSVINEFERRMGVVEFAPMIRECKSCSEYVIDMIQEGGFVIGHKLQLYHYLKGLNIPLGYVDYISKNDSLMEDTRVDFPDAGLEAQYNNGLTELKGYLEAGQQPPPAPLIVWEKKFKKNFNVEYSNYLKMIYGFEQPLDYSNAVSGKIASWNRVLARIKDVAEGKRNKPTKAEPLGALTKLTDKNLSVIDEMTSEGLNPYELAKDANVTEEETNE
jgi:putative component of membrane protein insertase Oxa1/YidC/SpoIIIJ protein YidD